MLRWQCQSFKKLNSRVGEEASVANYILWLDTIVKIKAHGVETEEFVCHTDFYVKSILVNLEDLKTGFFAV